MKPFFTIFLGSPKGSARLDEHDRVSALHQITRHFDAFTLSEGKGFFDGCFEDVLLIHVATETPREVVLAAEDLRRTFNQKGVGIEYAGHYLRVRADEPIDDVVTSLSQAIGRVRGS